MNPMNGFYDLENDQITLELEITKVNNNTNETHNNNVLETIL